MVYSTIAEFRGNVSVGTVSNIADAIVTARITLADKAIESDLGNLIDFSLIVATPDFLSLLSQYKVAELCLVYMYGRKRESKEVTDVDYWQGEYDKLKNRVLNGDVTLEDGSTTPVNIAKGQHDFENTAKDGIRPELGMDDWGDFKSKADILEDRPIE